MKVKSTPSLLILALGPAAPVAHASVNASFVRTFQLSYGRESDGAISDNNHYYPDGVGVSADAISSPSGNDSSSGTITYSSEMECDDKIPPAQVTFTYTVHSQANSSATLGPAPSNGSAPQSGSASATAKVRNFTSTSGPVTRTIGEDTDGTDKHSGDIHDTPVKPSYTLKWSLDKYGVWKASPTFETITLTASASYSSGLGGASPGANAVRPHPNDAPPVMQPPAYPDDQAGATAKEDYTNWSYSVP